MWSHKSSRNTFAVVILLKVITAKEENRDLQAVAETCFDYLLYVEDSTFRMFKITVLVLTVPICCLQKIAKVSNGFCFLFCDHLFAIYRRKHIRFF